MVKGSGVFFGHRRLPIVSRFPKKTPDPFSRPFLAQRSIVSGRDGANECLGPCHDGLLVRLIEDAPAVVLGDESRVQVG